MSTINLIFGTQAYLNFQLNYDGSKPAQVAPQLITCYSEAIMCMIRLDIRINHHLLLITSKINKNNILTNSTWSTMDIKSQSAVEWAIIQAKNVLKYSKKYALWSQHDQLEQIRLRIHHYERVLHYLKK